MDLTGAAAAVLISLLWGANSVVIKLGLEDTPPLRLAAMRVVVGGIVICLWAWATGRFAAFRIERWEWRPLAVLGLLFSVQMGATNIGTWLTSASHATVLVNLYAVHTVVLAHFMIPGDRLTPAKVGGVLVAYTGIVLLFARDFSFRSETLVGDLVVAASAVLLAERVVYMARAVQRFDPLKLLVFQSAIGSACFLLASVVLESGVPTRYTPALAASLFYQGAVVAGFNFIVNSYLFKVYLASALATCSLTTPLFGVLVAAAVTGDQLSPLLLLSSVMVAAGIGLTVRR